MNRTHLMVYISLVFGPMLVHAGEMIQYEIDTKFVACPTNAVVPPDPFNPLALPASWTIVSAPRVTTVEGATAVLAILKDPPQYFEKQSNGSFRLREMGPQYETGITLKVTVTTGSSNKNVKVDKKIRFCSILRRNPLPGVSLNAGMPMMDVTESHSNPEMNLNGWSFSSLEGFYPGFNNTDQKMFLMLKVCRVNPKGQRIDANGQLITD